MQLCNYLYQFIKLSAFGQLPRLHSYLQRFYNFCKSPAIIYPAFCSWLLPIYTSFAILQLLSIQLSTVVLLPFYAIFCTSPAVICPVFCVFCCLSKQFFATLQLLSIQLFAVVCCFYTFFANLQLLSIHLSAVVCCLSSQYLQLSSYYLSSCLKWFCCLSTHFFSTFQLLSNQLSAVHNCSVYLYNFCNSPALIYHCFCSCSVALLAIFRNSPAVICPAFCSCPAGELPSCPAVQLQLSSWRQS
jgi:hypothetical protein